MPVKVLGIAPYEGLRDLFLDIAKSEKRIDLDVEVADLGEVFRIIEEESVFKYDVIISRGGTAELIRGHVDIPVIDIPVSGYDLLRVLTLIKDAHSKVAMVGFSNICQGAQTVSNLLDIDIPIYTIEHESEVHETLAKVLHAGTQIILGDVVTVRIASEMGCHGVLVTSGRESVQEALSEALRVYDVYSLGREKIRFFEKILERDPRGIFVFGAEGQVKFINRSAKCLVGSDVKEYSMDAIGSLVPELTAKVHDILHQKQDNWQGALTFLGKSFSVCFVANISDTSWPNVIVYVEPTEVISNVQNSLLKIPTRVATFAQIIGSSHAVQELVTRAKVIAKTNQNVWITGEPGTGKTLLAQAIHNAGQHSAGQFYGLSCNNLDIAMLDLELFGTSDLPGFFDRVAGGTLYLENIEALPKQLQEKLADRFERGVDIRLIVSSTVSWTNIMQQEDIPVKFVHFLAEHYVTIPPLRDRINDIEELARVYIALHNSRYGKQIVSVREDVLDLLKGHHWPGNIKEFKNTFEEILLLTRGHHVEREQAEIVWERYRESRNKENYFLGESTKGKVLVDLSGTLDDIEARIFLHVLKEEGMNQSKASSRLGINRSTLWRKLKNIDAK